ncbi:MAG TPA: Gfo/Idh/MocA family oxidoreductase [Acholeplasmataceae bacterium]|nr:Gfo/Idh/MocA family oxidoreductase [Acholeplasmataceae bacterium]
MHKIVTAIIGYGMSGRIFHLPPLINHPNYRIKSIMTRSEKNQSDLKKDYPQIEIVTNFHDVIEDPEIELVIMATSNDVHYAYTKEALIHGKHVVCEKPFVESYTKAKELFDLAHEKQLILRVFHNRKYDGDILTLKQLMQSRDFGRIVSFSTRFDRYVPEIGENWRFKPVDMAGIYYDLAPHLVHHAIDLFGLPNLVSNTLYDDREGTQVDDHFEMALYYDTHTCFLGAQVLDRDPKPRLELIGTKASYVKYGFDVPDTVNEATSDIYQTSGLRSEFIVEPGKGQAVPLLKGEHYRFYDLLAHHIDEYPEEDHDKTNALSVILVMQLGLISHQTNQMVKVPHKI